jgi:hypothetical protein
MLNPKHEARNSKQYLISKFKIQNVLNFEILIFEFVSYFDIRVSNF